MAKRPRKRVTWHVPPKFASRSSARKVLVAGKVLELAAEGGYDAVVKHFGKLPRNPRTGEKMDPCELIAWAIEGYMGDDAKRVAAARLIRELTLIAFANAKNYQDYFERAEDGTLTLRLDKLTPEQAAVISSIEPNQHGVKLRFWDKLEAIDKLGKWMGLFKERVEHSGAVATFVIEGLEPPKPPIDITPTEPAS